MKTTPMLSNSLLRKYSRRADLPLTHRLADFFAWAAEVAPQAAVSLAQLRKATGHEGRPNTVAVRRVLLSIYSRDLVFVRGVGYRATTTSADVVQTTLPGRMRRLQSAATNVKDTAAVVRRGDLPNDLKFAQWRRWYTTDVAATLRLIDSGGLTRFQMPDAKERKAKAKRAKVA